jgi:hypothetical protein
VVSGLSEHDEINPAPATAAAPNKAVLLRKLRLESLFCPLFLFFIK